MRGHGPQGRLPTGSRRGAQPPALPRRPRGADASAWGPQWRDAFQGRALARHMHATGRAPPPAPPPAPRGGAGVSASAAPGAVLDARSGGAGEPAPGEADAEDGVEGPSFVSARGTRAGAARRGSRMRRLAGWVADAARPAPSPAAAAAAAAAAGRAELLPLCRRMQVLHRATLFPPLWWGRLLV